MAIAGSLPPTKTKTHSTTLSAIVTSKTKLSTSTTKANADSKRTTMMTTPDMLAAFESMVNVAQLKQKFENEMKNSNKERTGMKKLRSRTKHRSRSSRRRRKRKTPSSGGNGGGTWRGSGTINQANSVLGMISDRKQSRRRSRGNRFQR